MATVQSVVDRAQNMLDKSYQASSPAAYLRSGALQFTKDAYDVISEATQLPRKVKSDYTIDAGTRSYSLPTDIFDGFNGIISVELDGVPLHLATMGELQDQFGEDWLAPGLTGEGRVYFEEDDHQKFSILDKPGSSDVGKVLRLIYVRSVPEPTTLADAIPTDFDKYVGHIPLYLVGRALEAEKRSRGAAIMQEFEARVTRSAAKTRRTRKSKSAGQRLTLDAHAYMKSYRGR